MTKALRLFVPLFLLASLAFAQKEPPGAKDHPMFSRMPGYFIAQYHEYQFDGYKFRVTKGNKTAFEQIEGHKYVITYNLPRGYTGTPPSRLQVLRNYQAAARAIGGESLWEAGNDAGTIRVVKGGREVWLEKTSQIGTGYTLTIVERQAMQQDVVANADAFFNSLRDTGKAAVYGIYFDTGKSELKPESTPALEEIAKLLKQNPAIKVGVVGHTDTVGEVGMNVKLSQARAQAVIAALTGKYGIALSRLSPFGAGPYAPVASNKDEDGRAKNRRVELVDLAAL